MSKTAWFSSLSAPVEKIEIRVSAAQFALVLPLGSPEEQTEWSRAALDKLPHTREAAAAMRKTMDEFQVSALAREKIFGVVAPMLVACDESDSDDDDDTGQTERDDFLSGVREKCGARAREYDEALAATEIKATATISVGGVRAEVGHVRANEAMLAAFTTHVETCVKKWRVYEELVADLACVTKFSAEDLERVATELARHVEIADLFEPRGHAHAHTHARSPAPKKQKTTAATTTASAAGPGPASDSIVARAAAASSFSEYFSESLPISTSKMANVTIKKFSADALRSYFAGCATKFAAEFRGAGAGDVAETRVRGTHVEAATQRELARLSCVVCGKAMLGELFLLVSPLAQQKNREWAEKTLFSPLDPSHVAHPHCLAAAVSVAPTKCPCECNGGGGAACARSGAVS